MVIAHFMLFIHTDSVIVQLSKFRVISEFSFRVDHSKEERDKEREGERHRVLERERERDKKTD